MSAAARYRITRRLGQGGMAEVFEAELVAELGFSRKVAIKRMLGEAASDADAARRFLDEARIASRLHHANIVSIVDFGLLDGLPFQVLELVDGIDAQQLATRSGGTLPVDIALIICGEVAHALDHAHTACGDDGLPLGIVHRDVKPSNVLVSWRGDVKLTDFGIAFAHERVAKTEAGLVAGTMGFIAPEQRLKSEIDGRSDVFALGLTLHALITGYTPLRDVTVEMAVLTGEPMPLDRDLPADLRDLIARAVAPRRLARPNAAELADLIDAALRPRLARDPRRALQEFLEPLHDRKPKAGAFDQLLGLDVVPSDATKPDSPRHFALRRTEVATEPAEPPRRRTGRIALAGTTAIVALAGGLWLFAGRGDAVRTLDASAIARTAPQVAGDAPAAAELPPADAAVPDAPRVADVRPAPGKHHEVHRGSAAAPPPIPTGTGYLQIVGEDNVGAKVVVDGREVGYAPNKLEVARGHHRVELVRKDGTRLAHEIDIGEYDTVAHPARPAF